VKILGGDGRMIQNPKREKIIAAGSGGEVRKEEKITFDYFRGYESEMFTFYRIPKVLFTDPYFRKLSSDAKVLYGLMLDRMMLSKRNNWVDEEDRVYIIFTLEEVMECMNCGRDKGMKILAELDSGKGIGLIERVKRGFGLPSIIYVKSFLIQHEPEEEISQEMDGESASFPEVGNVDVQKSEKPTSRGRKCRRPEVGNIDVMRSEKPTLIRTINNTDMSDTESINLSEDRMDGVQTYREMILENIDYASLQHTCSKAEVEYIDELVDLMTEIVSVDQEGVRIGGVKYPYQLVKSQLLRVGYEHIRYVLECLDKNFTKVRNVKAYLLTCLFNAPSTINSYYRAEVNHDLYGRDDEPIQKK
jgi:hypothetical protein